LMNF